MEEVLPHKLSIANCINHSKGSSSKARALIVYHVISIDLNDILNFEDLQLLCLQLSQKSICLVSGKDDFFGFSICIDNYVKAIAIYLLNCSK